MKNLDERIKKQFNKALFEKNGNKPYIILNEIYPNKTRIELSLLGRMIINAGWHKRKYGKKQIKYYLKPDFSMDDYFIAIYEIEKFYKKLDK